MTISRWTVLLVRATMWQRSGARWRALLDNPQLGPARPSIRPGLRIYPVHRRVVVAYRITEEGIRIVRVFSGGQDYEAILAAEE